VQAVSVNPIDIKQRMNTTVARNAAIAVPFATGPRVLGYDASGTVDAVGPDVTLFSPGDEVYCMAAVDRAGANAELLVVDERLVGRKPKILSHSQAAAMPLTTLTAWELLFGGLRVPRSDRTPKPKGKQTLLVVNGAGGVGSIIIQLAAQLTGLTIIATGSRPASIDWVKKMGADHVIDHRQPLDEGVRALSIDHVDYIASLTGTHDNMAAIARLIAPHGVVGIIDAPAVLDIVPLKSKSVTVAWEGVFVRSIHKTADMISQHEVLQEVAALVDAGILYSTMTEDMGRLCASNLAKAHTHIASGQAIGKTVLTGFQCK
jgi:zinc-binding alcohol dehydrogenase family protein